MLIEISEELSPLVANYINEIKSHELFMNKSVEQIIYAGLMELVRTNGIKHESICHNDQKLKEVMSALGSKTSDRKKKTSAENGKKGGRPKISFPENWEYLFDKYSKKEISVNEFQQLTGLKRTTFYNFLCQYKEQIRLEK